MVTLISFACKDSSIRKVDDVKTETNEEKKLPEGYYWGEVKSYIGKDRIEKNLMSQISSYNKALLRGDIESASNYFYSDALEYLKKYYPEDYMDEDILNELLKDVSDKASRLYQEYRKTGMDIQFIVCNIDRTIKTESAILCVFGITVQTYYDMAKGEKYFHKVPEKDDYILGLSFNNGQNWYFIALNDDTPNILRSKFSNEVIIEVMGY